MPDTQEGRLSAVMRKEGFMDNTVELLRECDAGCKIAVMNINHVCEYVKDNELKCVLASYRDEHERLDSQICEALKEESAGEKDPSLMARAMSWINTDIKMMTGDVDKQIAKLMMDGSNMGIQTVSENVSKYGDADKESVGYAKKLITIEEHFMRDMKKFL